MSAVYDETHGIVPVADSSPAGLLAIAVQRGTDADQLGKLLDLQERWEAGQARKAYAAAMKAVQGEAPKIAKEATNTQTKSQYALLETINAGLVPVYTRHGFSLSFSQGDSPTDGHIRIVCDVSHEAGHSEVRHVDLPLDMAGINGNVNKTAIHATGSTYSYGRRYLTCMIFNVSTGDDDDGQASGKSMLEALADENAKLRLHNETVRDWFETIYCVKIALRDGELDRAAEARLEMPDDVVGALNLAPTKGGIWTTKEREIMKSDEWSRAKRAFLGQPEPNGGSK